MSDSPQKQTLGKYTIVRELGRGAFATVYLAHDTVLHRDVALKILHPALLGDPVFVASFENEARAIAQFDHPHIATIYDFGEYQGRIYIAVQFLSGGSLADHIKRNGPLAFADAVRVLEHVADALDHAHAAGFIHRDIKPSNILLNGRGAAVLTDFGLVKAAESSAISRSTMGGILGTPPYMAPEVWEDKADSPQTDIYALGCVLFEALTGEQLFKGKTPPAIMRSHFDPHRYPEHWPDGTPKEVEEILERALARDPAAHYPSAGALATDLRQLAIKAADPLAKPYHALQAAITNEQWVMAAKLAQEISAQNPSYRDVRALGQRAAEALKRIEAERQAAQRAAEAQRWRAEAEQALAAKDITLAWRAVESWRSVAPEDAAMRVMQARLGRLSVDPTTHPKTDFSARKQLSRRDFLRIATVGLGTITGGSLLAFWWNRQTAGTGAITSTPTVSGIMPTTTVPTAIPTAAKATAASATTTPAPADVPAVDKEFHGAWPCQLPPKGHYNSFVPDFIDFGIYNDVLETPLAIYDWANSKFLPLLAIEWKNDADNWYTIKLRSGLKWSDSSEFSSDDVFTTFQLARVMGLLVWRYIDKVEALDKTTVRFHFVKPSSVAPRFILKTRIRPNSVYKDLGKKAKALASKPQESDENKALREELTKFRPTDFVTSGPVKLDPASITSSRLTLVKSEGGFNADKFAFDAVVLYNGETPDITPMVLSKDIDYATHGFPPATEKSFTDAGIRIIRPALLSGPAIYFNYTNKDLAKVEVRQAIAYAVKRDESATVSMGDSGKAVKYMTGFSDNMVPTWIDQADVAKLNTYDYDPAKAEELLTKAGYTKGGDGVWAGPNGPLEFELTAPAEFADWSAAAENLATQLTDFGIKTTFRGVQFQQHNEDVQQGKFTLAIRGWGAGNPHPFFSYETDLLLYNPPRSPGPGMSLPFKQTVDSKQVDLNELLNKMVEGADEAGQKAPVTELAVEFNKLLPIVPLWERYGNNASLEGVRVDKFPADDPIWKNPVYADNPVVVLLLQGELKPKA